MIKILISMLLMFSVPDSTENTCPTPSNVQVYEADPGLIFDWDDCNCSYTTYKIKYYRQADNHMSPDYSTGNSNYTFSSLPNGIYDIYIWTVCGSEVSDAIIIEDLVNN